MAADNYPQEIYPPSTATQLPEHILYSEMPAGSEVFEKRRVQVMAAMIPHPFMCRTLEDRHNQNQYGKPGDYLVRGIRGELYPVDREIFLETYRKPTELVVEVPESHLWAKLTLPFGLFLMWGRQR